MVRLPQPGSQTPCRSCRPCLALLLCVLRQSATDPQSYASDTFQARKVLLIVTCTISFIGAAIAPGANNIYRVIVAQILVGFGFAAVPLAYAIPSEVSNPTGSTNRRSSHGAGVRLHSPS